MVYSEVQLEARELRDQGVKVADIEIATGLSRDQIGDCTWDIWKKKNSRNYLTPYLEARRMLADFQEEVSKDPRVKDASSKGILNIIADKLEVSVEFVWRQTRDIADETAFVDNKKGVWVEKTQKNDETSGKKTIYVNTLYLRRKTGWKKNRIGCLLRVGGVSSTLLWTNVRANRQQKFYRLREVQEKVPEIRERLDELDNYLFRYRPPELKKEHYKILCAFLTLRNKHGSWPSNSQIAGNLQEDGFSPSYVKSVMGSLLEKAYFRVIYHKGSNYRQSIIVHWGPKPLITRKEWKNGKFIRVDRPYVERYVRIKKG